MNRLKKVIIVTGSCGKIGTSVIRKLHPDFKIIGFEFSKAIYAVSDEELVPIDLSSDESVEQAFRHIESVYGKRIASVIHLATYYSFEKEHSSLYESVSVQGTKRLLKALQNFEVDQLIFSSTMLVYASTQPGFPISEEGLIEPRWDYPVSKVKAEELIHQLKGKMKTVIFRISVVYDDLCNSIPLSRQIQRIYENRIESRLYPGSLEKGVPFIHMSDLVDAIALAVLKRDELPEETVLILSDPKTLSYDQIQRLISRLIRGKEFKTWRIPKSIAKVIAYIRERIPFISKPFVRSWMIDWADDHYEFDISKAKKILNWVPKHDIEETLPIMIAELKREPLRWYRINQFHNS